MAFPICERVRVSASEVLCAVRATAHQMGQLQNSYTLVASRNQDSLHFERSAQSDQQK